MNNCLEEIEEKRCKVCGVGICRVNQDDYWEYEDKLYFKYECNECMIGGFIIMTKEEIKQ